MKALSVAAKWLFILCLPLLLLSASIGLAFNSLWLYKAGFDKYGISRVTGLADAELEKAARGLISYFGSPDELIDVTVEKDGAPFTLFNQREVIHLKDVKGLVWLDYKVLFGTLLYFLAYGGFYLLWPIRPFRRRTQGKHRPLYWRGLALSVLTGSGITLALVLALGLGTLIGFDQLFLQFHLISFSNEFWQLNPATDYLIMLFPQGFWYDATLFIALATTGMAAILAILSGGHLLFNKKGVSR